MRRKNNKTMMLALFNQYPDMIVTRHYVFDAGSTNRRVNDIEARRENEFYPMTLATLNSLIKDGRLVLIDEKKTYQGTPPYGWTNYEYTYKVKSW